MIDINKFEKLADEIISNVKKDEMKTPLQQIYAHLKASKEKDSFGDTYCVDWLLENESKMLVAEEEMIKYSYLEGVKSGL